MAFILIKDECRCNFCAYWIGMRKKAEDFVYVDPDAAERGICLHPESVMHGKQTMSCEGCSLCEGTP